MNEKEILIAQELVEIINRNRYDIKELLDVKVQEIKGFSFMKNNIAKEKQYRVVIKLK